VLTYNGLRIADALTSCGAPLSEGTNVVPVGGLVLGQRYIITPAMVFQVIADAGGSGGAFYNSIAATNTPSIVSGWASPANRCSDDTTQATNVQRFALGFRVQRRQPFCLVHRHEDLMSSPTPQFDIADIHNEYAQQVAMLSQRCAMLTASNGALHRANAALTARLTEMESQSAQDAPLPDIARAAD
jgi:hypothetical protein